ncbi:uncharacterized protein LOC117199428 isoform X1 [Orcinus orca]|uniref:uncharacterized protein LOC117199428 isoform X1 n=1 Tax=Orcinus orca TaxID=9733 RepID=UPI0021115817|nr:uncharacterized protein LOC117199428 isoform X1 [Orcinus orca]
MVRAALEVLLSHWSVLQWAPLSHWSASQWAPPPNEQLPMSSLLAHSANSQQCRGRQAESEVPVACKSCPCGYVFINRKLLKIKHSEKSSTFTEIATAPPAFSNHHPDQSAAINIKARASTSKKRMTEGSDDG